MKYKILHLTPHLGGGVGTVLRSYLKKENIYTHKVFSLDTINELSKEIMTNKHISFKESVSSKHQIILNEISLSDILIIHWWNHPLLYEFIIKNKLPKSRVIIWSHVSGLEVPQIFTKKLFDYCDYFVFTTPISYKSNEFLNYNGNKNKFLDIWSTAGFEKFKKIKHKKQKKFTIGYIGAIDFSKLHPDFIKICKKINIKDVKFIVCGDGSNLSTIKKEVKKYQIEDKFEFPGYVKDIKPYLQKFDIFLYPLNQKHYGTCDQVLTEAMSCGIVPVVFNNPMERYIVHDSYTGIVTNSKQDMIKQIERISKDTYERQRLGSNAKEEVCKRFEINNTIKKWNKLYSKILKQKKTEKKWLHVKSQENIEASTIFLESLGSYSNSFKSNPSKSFMKYPSMKALTKGTPKHYQHFFKNDKQLKEWIINEK